jgi:uncharacterized membrane protein YkoI
MKHLSWIVSMALVAPVASAYADDPYRKDDTTQNQKLTRNDLPDAVKTSLDREAKGKTIDAISKDTENGKTIYKVDLMSNGKMQTLTFDANGKVTDRGAMREMNKKP